MLPRLTRAALMRGAQRRFYRAFPSLVINNDGYHPKGAFAEAQADFLRPEEDVVQEVDTLLRDTNVGIVAHFYMDPELQGILGAVGWKHVFTSDSLAMADAAVEMAEQGVDKVVVMGVDFMSENVRAVLDHKGYENVKVYRMAAEEIGCTLAASAETKGYNAWLQKARSAGNSLHVVYINTSLLTKARAHAICPTITCTSSNVVRTILQAFSQIPDLTVWYGPDTHMGENLVTLFTAMKDLPDSEIQKIHPAHNQETIKALIPNLEVYPQGTCVVHEMFGTRVVKQLREEYSDCYHTAHFEVPGEMFELASKAKLEGKGTVGSTADILNFITQKIDAAVAKPGPQTVKVTLGTEAGMITPIARSIRKTLSENSRSDINLEIVFPVSSDAVAAESGLGTGIVPGVASGEGCSTAGGCATCKYMKMNSLNGLVDLLNLIKTNQAPTLLSRFHPKKYTEHVDGRSAAEVGGETILHMRSFQRTARIPDTLVEHVASI